MRISDWSSDVCSSDLQIDQGTCGQGTASAGWHRVHREIRTALRISSSGKGEAQCAERAPARKRGAYRCAGGPEGRGYDRDEHGRTRDRHPARRESDRTSVVAGKSVSERVDLGGRGTIKKKKKPHKT